MKLEMLLDQAKRYGVFTCSELAKLNGTTRQTLHTKFPELATELKKIKPEKKDEDRKTIKIGGKTYGIGKDQYLDFYIAGKGTWAISYTEIDDTLDRINKYVEDYEKIGTEYKISIMEMPVHRDAYQSFHYDEEKEDILNSMGADMRIQFKVKPYDTEYLLEQEIQFISIIYTGEYIYETLKELSAIREFLWCVMQYDTDTHQTFTYDGKYMELICNGFQGGNSSHGGFIKFRIKRDAAIFMCDNSNVYGFLGLTEVDIDDVYYANEKKQFEIDRTLKLNEYYEDPDKYPFVNPYDHYFIFRGDFEKNDFYLLLGDIINKLQE